MVAWNKVLKVDIKEWIWEISRRNDKYYNIYRNNIGKKNQGMQDSKNVLGILINFTDCQSWGEREVTLQS